MISKKTMGWSAVLVGILMALTEYMSWNGNLHYLWALLVLVWGIMAFK